MPLPRKPREPKILTEEEQLNKLYVNLHKQIESGSLSKSLITVNKSKFFLSRLLSTYAPDTDLALSCSPSNKSRRRPSLKYKMSNLNLIR